MTEYPESTRLGSTDCSACPRCGNSLQNGTPCGSPELRRCATCKTIFRKYTKEEKLVIIKKTNEPGIFTVHRTEREKPFAELHGPQARGGRKWGIKYRGTEDDCPFDSMVFNFSTPNRKMAIEELERTSSCCSAAQLCLEALPEEEIKKTELLEFVRLIGGDPLDYNEGPKLRFHQLGKKIARALAKEMGLKSGTYDVRSNPGGIAVSGEITLHGEGVYVQFSQSSAGPSMGVLYRTCQGRSDFAGGHNQWMRFECLENFEHAAITIARNVGLALFEH